MRNKSILWIASSILFFIMSASTYGQTSITENEVVRASLDKMFMNLDKSKVPTGLLLDYAIDIVDFDKYDGRELTDSNYVSLSILENILRSVNSASVTSTLPVANIETLTDNPLVSSNVNIFLALFKYNYLKANVIEDGLLTYDESTEQVSDRYIDGIWQNPYEENYIAAFAPSSAISPSLNVEFTFSSSNIKSNVSEGYSVQFDAGDGVGFRTVNVSDVLNVNYPESGLKELRMRIALGDKLLELHSQIYVEKSISVLSTDTEPNLQIVKSASYEGVTVKGLMSCYFSNNSSITKPFIVVEGFDPWEYLTLVGEENIIESGVHLGETNHLSFYNTDWYDNDYDLIYIDWDNSLEDIKANAKLLEAFIQEVNSMKESSGCAEPTILMGQSMGGLVARYALCSMENAGKEHQISTFVTHDTPHLGANVPLGALYFVNQIISCTHGYDKVVGIADLFMKGELSDYEVVLNKILNSKSAKQMLINFVDSKLKIDNTVHNQWQSELFLLGFPKMPQNLAIVNGRAFQQNLAYDSHYLYAEGSIKTRFLADISLTLADLASFTILGKYLKTINLAPIGRNLKWLGSNKLMLNAEINPLSSSNSNRVLSELSLKYTKKYLWLISKTYKLFYDKRMIPAGIMYYDDMPGSKFSISLDGDNNKDGLPYVVEGGDKNALVKYSYKFGIVSDIMFVPSASALCAWESGDLTQKMAMSDFYTSPPDISSSPFDAYYLFNEATNHIDINKDVYDWIGKQSNFEIKGAQRAESGAVYRVDGFSGVKWYTSDKTKATISSTGVLQAIGSGSVEIIAEKYEDGKMYRARKDVIVDFPDMIIDCGYKVGTGYVATARTLNYSDMEYINKLVASGELEYEWTLINEDGNMSTTVIPRNTYSFIPEEKGISTICARLVDGDKKGELYSVTIDDGAIFKLCHPYVIVNSEGKVIIASEPYFGPMSTEDVFSIKFNSFPTGNETGLEESIDKMKREGCYISCVSRLDIQFRSFGYNYDYGTYVAEKDVWEFRIFNKAWFLDDIQKAKESREDKVIRETHITLFDSQDESKNILQTFKFTIFSKPDFMVLKPKPDPGPDFPIVGPIE